MLHCNQKTIAILGYPNGSMAQEFIRCMENEEHYPGGFIMRPEDFVLLSDFEKNQYQYAVAFVRDRELRKKVCNIIDSLNLDTVIYISPETEFFGKIDDIGGGTFIFSKSLICQNSKIGRHVAIHTFCLIAHYVDIGDRTVIHSDVKIAGRTTIGPDCEFNFGTKIGQGISVCNDVKLGEFSAFHKDVTTPGFYVGYPSARRVGDFVTEL